MSQISRLSNSQKEKLPNVFFQVDKNMQVVKRKDSCMPKEMNIFILEGEGKQENPHFAILYRNKAG